MDTRFLGIADEVGRFPFATVAILEGSLVVPRPHAMPSPAGEDPV